MLFTNSSMLILNNVMQCGDWPGYFFMKKASSYFIQGRDKGGGFNFHNIILNVTAQKVGWYSVSSIPGEN